MKIQKRHNRILPRKSLIMAKGFAFALSGILQLSLATPVHSQTATSVPLSTPQRVNLDLNSTARTVSTPRSQSAPVSITVGGVTTTIAPGTLLTPAERLAVFQVLSTGQQSIILGAKSNAIGGNMTIGANFGRYVSGLSIPKGVTVFQNAAMAPVVNLTGSLTNSGSYFAVSTNPAQKTAAIIAGNIINQTGGLLSSQTHGTEIASLSGIVSSVNLSLTAVKSIVNAGTIYSSGTLSLSAGESIVNALAPAANAPSPLMQAYNTLNLTSNNIVNHGQISSLIDNINIQPFAVGSLNVTAGGGIFKALLGNINIDASQAPGNISLTGGDYLSQVLNLSAPDNVLVANLGKVTGIVNASASCLTLGAATPDLHLGLLNVTGDPTYFNTSGSLILSSIPKSNGEDLSLIASGNIIVQGGTIDTTSSKDGGRNDGGNITIMAGANFESSNSVNENGDTITTLTITQSQNPGGGSTTGGAIDLSNVSAINAYGSVTLNGEGGNGGNIHIIAFSGSGAGDNLLPGTINLGTTGSINCFGGGANSGGGSANGNLTIYAGATADQGARAAVILPPIFAGSPATYSQTGVARGKVTIATASPVISAPITIENGRVQPGSGNLSAGALQPTSIEIGSVGGGNSVRVETELMDWQVEAANYALDAINQERAKNGRAPLIYSPLLQQIAVSEAQYIGTTGNFAHFELRGGSLTERMELLGFSPSGAGENLGAGAGSTTPKQAFDNSNAGMMSEPNQVGNHRWNLLNHKYVGIGFVDVGGAYYIAEVFSDSKPGSPISEIPGVPVHGGISGPNGLTTQEANANLNTSSGLRNAAIDSMGGAYTLPVSIIAGSDRTGGLSITAGKSVTALGTIVANGANGVRGIGPLWGAGHGGDIQISAGGNINLFNLQSSGGTGGSSASDPMLGSAGNGGNITLSSANGNITITPGGPFLTPVEMLGTGTKPIRHFRTIQPMEMLLGTVVKS